MANKQTLQSSSLEIDYPLFENDTYNNIWGSWGNFKIEGQWFPIRLNPDLSTGELLNIGIGFVDENGIIHTRLLPHANSLSYMYGKQGAENFSFLLKIIKEHFEISKEFTSPSPQIKLGELSYASGDNIEAILSGLYYSMISLIADENTLDKSYNKNAISNRELRRSFSKIMQKEAPNEFRKYFINDPVKLKDKDGRYIEVDLQIWSQQSDFIKKSIPFGSVISAHYLEKVYRGCNLGNGCQDMINTATLVSNNSKGYLGILKPEKNSKGFSNAEVIQIENEIEKTSWVITKHHKNILIAVDSDPRKLFYESLSIFT